MEQQHTCVFETQIYCCMRIKTWEFSSSLLGQRLRHCFLGVLLQWPLQVNPEVRVKIMQEDSGVMVLTGEFPGNQNCVCSCKRFSHSPWMPSSPGQSGSGRDQTWKWCRWIWARWSPWTCETCARAETVGSENTEDRTHTVRVLQWWARSLTFYFESKLDTLSLQRKVHLCTYTASCLSDLKFDF